MEKSNIDNLFCYHIIPFVFDKEYVQVKKDLASKSNGENNVWEGKKFNAGQRLFEHVKKLIYDNDASNETIGIRYQLKDNARVMMGLTGNAGDQLILKLKNDKEYQYKIKNIHLYVFETQIGFLAFEIEYDIKNNQLEYIIEANYNIKNIVQNRDSIYHRKKISANESVDIKLPMNQIISKLTEELSITTFFENELGLPKQAIAYNAVCLKDVNPEKSFIERYLYEMRRLFRKSYKPSSEDLKIEDNKEVVQLFENCYWGASLEGVANLYYLTEDDETNAFFKNSYKGAITNTYLYIFFIALHQRYALLNYLTIASQIKKTSSVSKEDLDIIESIKTEKMKIAYYNLRCSFKNLSNITHQNKVYGLIRETLKLDDLSDEVNKELFGLAQILENQEEKVLVAEEIAKKKEEREKEKVRVEEEKCKNQKEAQRFNFLTIAVASLAAFFWLPSIVVSFWDIISRTCEGKIPFSGTWMILISILFPLLFVIIPSVIVFILHNKSKKDK